MVSSKQRSRQLARAKWERQQQRRTRASARRRRLGLVGGVITGLVASGALVWLTVTLVSGDDGLPAAPTSTFKTDLKTPVTPGATAQASPGGSETSVPASTPSSAPASDGAPS